MLKNKHSTHKYNISHSLHKALTSTVAYTG